MKKVNEDFIRKIVTESLKQVRLQEQEQGLEAAVGDVGGSSSSSSSSGSGTGTQDKLAKKAGSKGETAEDYVKDMKDALLKTQKGILTQIRTNVLNTPQGRLGLLRALAKEFAGIDPSILDPIAGQLQTATNKVKKK